MKQQFLDNWIKPVINSPRATIAGFAALAALFLPHHSTEIAAAAAAIGLIFAGDATSSK